MMKVDARGPTSRPSRRRRRRSSSGLTIRPDSRSPIFAQSRQNRSTQAGGMPATLARMRITPITARIALGSPDREARGHAAAEGHAFHRRVENVVGHHDAEAQRERDRAPAPLRPRMPSGKPMIVKTRAATGSAKRLCSST